MLWRPDGTIVPIPDAGEARVQSPLAINNDGVVVGYVERWDSVRDAFVWTEADGTLDLQSLLDASGAGWDLNYATDINEAGQIIGRGQYQGRLLGFVLTPVPEPTGAALCAVGCAALLTRRRCR